MVEIGDIDFAYLRNLQKEIQEKKRTASGTSTLRENGEDTVSDLPNIKNLKKFVSTTSANQRDAMLVMEAKDEFEEIGVLEFADGHQEVRRKSGYKAKSNHSRKRSAGVPRKKSNKPKDGGKKESRKKMA